MVTCATTTTTAETQPVEEIITSSAATLEAGHLPDAPMAEAVTTHPRGHHRADATILPDLALLLDAMRGTRAAVLPTIESTPKNLYSTQQSPFQILKLAVKH